MSILKLENLKQLIEKEVYELDNTYKNVDKEVSISYELKREKLNKEEFELKENLKFQVNKIKEKLEIYLSEIYNLSKTCEIISKGVISLENEEKSMIKELSYISRIYTNKEKMRIIFQELMKNMKIYFIEDESKIKYEEYFFSGVPNPTKIEIKEISSISFRITWNLDKISILNINKKEVKFIIELRKSNQFEKFKQIYKGKETNLVINGLERNTNYEIRIRSIYKDLIGNWSQIYKVKTKNFIIDSVILSETERGIEFVHKLYEWSGYKEMELLYRGTRDGSGSNIFHNKCDNQGPTICLIKNDKGNIFGGYSSISWTSSGGYKPANGSFLFTLTNIYRTAPIKFPNSQHQNYAVNHSPNYGPIFGGGTDLCINDNYLNNTSSNSNFGYSYPDVLGKGRSIFTGESNNNINKIIIKELEVFKLR